MEITLRASVLLTRRFLGWGLQGTSSSTPQIPPPRFAPLPPPIIQPLQHSSPALRPQMQLPHIIGTGRQQPACQLLLLSRALGNRCGSGKEAHLAGAGRQQNNCCPSAPSPGLAFLIGSPGHGRCSGPR